MLGLGAYICSVFAATLGGGSVAAGMFSVLMGGGSESLGVVLRVLIGWPWILLLLVRLVVTRGTSISFAFAVSMGRLVLRRGEGVGCVSLLAVC
jgi:hypothetical protein